MIKVGNHRYRFYTSTCPICKKVFKHRQYDQIHCGKECGYKYLSLFFKNRKFSKEWKEKISKSKIGNKAGLGKKLTQKQKDNLRDCHLGSKNPQWKGGTTKFIYRIRQLAQYKKWRGEILQRDFPGITPEEVKKRKLQVHHHDGVKEMIDRFNLKTIEDVINCPKFWDISNGMSLKKGEHFLITSLERMKYPTQGFVEWMEDFVFNFRSKTKYKYVILEDEEEIKKNMDETK